MDGKPAVPSDRAGLYVFSPPGGALAPGQMVEVGFEHEGTYPQGTSKNGGRLGGIHPACIGRVDELSSQLRTDTRVSDAVGIDDENRQEPRSFAMTSMRATDSFFGARAPYTTKITVTAPADFTVNSVGTKTAEP